MFEDEATFVYGSSTQTTDLFSFRLVPGMLEPGTRLCFCLKYVSQGDLYWDNNGGGNYVFQVTFSFFSGKYGHMN